MCCEKTMLASSYLSARLSPPPQPLKYFIHAHAIVGRGGIRATTRAHMRRKVLNSNKKKIHTYVTGVRNIFCLLSIYRWKLIILNIAFRIFCKPTTAQRFNRMCDTYVYNLNAKCWAKQYLQRNLYVCVCVCLLRRGGVFATWRQYKKDVNIKFLCDQSK